MTYAVEAEAVEHAPVERESMDFDVVIVGAGPAGLAAAIRLKQRAAETGADISVAVLEKGAEVGAHILSGAVLDPVGLDALTPGWRDRWDADAITPVTKDQYRLLRERTAISLPNFVMPPLMSNHGAVIASLGDVCRNLAAEAEALGVEVYPGFAAADYVIADGAVRGVITNDMGVAKDGTKTGDYQPGMALMGRYVLFGEGARGSLSKRLIAQFGLDAGKEPQKYGIGLKELWEVPAENHRPGLIRHSFGWPLSDDVGGGSFLYHFAPKRRLVAIGFVVHLNYANPYLDPYREFQRFKHHPDVAAVLAGGKRLSYGARAIVEGGFQSVPTLVFPGGALIGDAAGFVNLPRIKGSHNAIRTGMAAADAAFDALVEGRGGDVLDAYQAAYEAGPVAKELRLVRNVKPLWSRFGLLGGIILGGLDMWLTTLFGGFSPFGALKHGKTDAACTGRAEDYQPIDYPKPDGVLSFDRMSSVFVSNTNHEEDQPSHLKLRDPSYPLARERPVWGAPSTRYCPAGVYEYVEEASGPRFQINAQNCVHCKTCDIKDPEQQIVWTPPEGGGGPNYVSM